REDHRDQRHAGGLRRRVRRGVGMGAGERGRPERAHDGDRDPEEAEVAGSTADPPAADRVGRREVREAAVTRALFLIGALIACAAPACATTGGDDVILRAMLAEMQRRSALHLPSADAPYFVGYTIDDEYRYEADATFGALTWTNETHRRPAKIEVRVGSYDFDSSDFVRQWAVPDPTRRDLPLADDVLALRRDLWLGTDAAYKQALEQLAAKHAA